jgi:peptidoglycan/LPS O-acetylase OafA/YrhL
MSNAQRDRAVEALQSRSVVQTSVCSLQVQACHEHRLSYNPNLDGIRGLAVLAVMFAHFQIPGFAGGGSVGVRLFFVLSGFLITRVVIADFEQGRSLWSFYWRRFLRLAPAMFLVCVALLLLPRQLAEPEQAFKDVLASASYVSNFTRAFETGTPWLFGHSWSLAVEEQFYLIWPLVLVILLRGGSMYFSALLTLAFITVVWTWRLWLARQGAPLDRLDNGFDTQCDALLVGSLIALIGVGSGDPNRELRFEKYARRLSWIAIAALSMLTAMPTLNPYRQIGPDSWTVTAVICGATIAAAARPGTSYLDRLLGSRGLVCIGMISYGLYLWHGIIGMLLLYSLQLSVLHAALIGIPLSFLVAYLSFRYVERPLLQLKYMDTGHFEVRAGKLAAASTFASIILGAAYFAAINDSPEPRGSLRTITAYGPRAFKHGDQFNVRPLTGQSTIWVTASRPLPPGSRIRLGSTLLDDTAIQGIGISAAIPDNLELGSGALPLTLVNGDGHSLSDTALVTVLP